MVAHDVAARTDRIDYVCSASVESATLSTTKVRIRAENGEDKSNMNMGKVTVTFRGRAYATLIWVRVKGAQVYLEIRQPNGETPSSFDCDAVALMLTKIPILAFRAYDPPHIVSIDSSSYFVLVVARVGLMWV